MGAHAISLEIDRDLAELVLDRPPRNEMDALLFAELGRLGRERIPALDVRGMVVRGRGRHISSGADLEELWAMIGERGEAEAAQRMAQNSAAVSALASCRFPVVAAISGCCLGAGLELALACHYRVATSNALLALPETQHGIMPGLGGTVRLPALVGAGRAIELILSGQALSADQALALGLVDAVVHRRDLLEAAIGLVARGLPRTGSD